MPVIPSHCRFYDESCRWLKIIDETEHLESQCFALLVELCTPVHGDPGPSACHVRFDIQYGENHLQCMTLFHLAHYLLLNCIVYVSRTRKLNSWSLRSTVRLLTPRKAAISFTLKLLSRKNPSVSIGIETFVRPKEPGSIAGIIVCWFAAVSELL